MNRQADSIAIIGARDNKYEFSCALRRETRCETVSITSGLRRSLHNIFTRLRKGVSIMLKREFGRRIGVSWVSQRVARNCAVLVGGAALLSLSALPAASVNLTGAESVSAVAAGQAGPWGSDNHIVPVGFVSPPSGGPGFCTEGRCSGGPAEPNDPTAEPNDPTAGSNCFLHERCSRSDAIGGGLETGMSVKRGNQLPSGSTR